MKDKTAGNLLTKALSRQRTWDDKVNVGAVTSDIYSWSQNIGNIWA